MSQQEQAMEILGVEMQVESLASEITEVKKNIQSKRHASQEVNNVIEFIFAGVEKEINDVIVKIGEVKESISKLEEEDDLSARYRLYTHTIGAGLCYNDKGHSASPPLNAILPPMYTIAGINASLIG